MVGVPGGWYGESPASLPGHTHEPPLQSRREEIDEEPLDSILREEPVGFHFHTITVLFNLDLMCFWNP